MAEPTRASPFVADLVDEVARALAQISAGLLLGALALAASGWHP